ncbi:hypothetical protein O6027_03165 [Sphingomonas aerolata]
MVPDVFNPFFAEVLRGTEEAAQAAGYSVLLSDTRDDLDREAQYPQWRGRPSMGDIAARSGRAK